MSEQAEVKSVKTVQAKKPVVELGEGLELWFVDINDLQEQSLNARVMSTDAFKQLAENIGKRGIPESMPLTALVEGKLEIVSGHHRIRATRKAGITELWVIVDVSGLSRDGVRAKQLAHNSIQGEDNEQLVQKILGEIDDLAYRIESFIQPVEIEGLKAPIELVTKDLDVLFDTKTAVLVFLPAQFEIFNQAVQRLKDVEKDEVVLATLDEYDTLISTMDSVSDTFKIQSAPTIIAKMCEIVLAKVDEVTDKAED